MFLKPQHLHFIGIGGIGMSGIAEVLLELGFTISGSDVKLTPITARLAGLGAKVFEGHRAENIEGAKAGELERMGIAARSLAREGAAGRAADLLEELGKSGRLPLT
jgi:UDP-N-acetylmuramate-alanine ligase